MENLVGRFKEAKILKDAVSSRKSEFIAVYGRPRCDHTSQNRKVKGLKKIKALVYPSSGRNSYQAGLCYHVHKAAILDKKK